MPHLKQILVIAGIATVTMFVWSFLAKSTVPVLSGVAQKVTGG